MNAATRKWLRPLAAVLVTAVIGVGLTAATPQSAVADTSVPGKPARTGSVGYDSMVVAWTGVSGALGYQVEWSQYKDFSKWVHTVDVTDPNKTAALLTGMGGNVTYYFHVRTYDHANKVATSAFSSYGYSTTKYSTSKKTSAVSITNVSGTSVEMNWVNIGGSVSGYQLKASASGRSPVYVSTTSTGVTMKPLVKSTKYKIYVAAAETVDANVVFVPSGGPNSVRTGPFNGGTYVTTSSYPLAAPSDFAAKNATPTTVELTWTVPTGTQATDRFRIDYGLDSAIKEGATYQIVDGPTSTTLANLKTNTQYYVRIRVVAADGTIRSDRSDYVLAKTRIPYGTVTGKVNGPTGTDIVIAAFKGSDFINQVEVASDNTYSIKLRPDTYRLKAIYVGQGNYTSLWVWNGNPGGRFIDESSVITVAESSNTNAPTVTLAKGGTLSGTVKVAGSGRAGVDVTVMSNEANGGNEVAGMARTATGGSYKVTGLPPGEYKVRYRLTGYDIATKYITIDQSPNSISGFDVTLYSH